MSPRPSVDHASPVSSTAARQARPDGVVEAKKNRLFAGVYPGGIVYADRQVEEYGDYRRLGFLPYDTLKLQLSKRVPKDLLKRIQKSAEEIALKKGQPFHTSSSGGQYVILGSRA